MFLSTEFLNSSEVPSIFSFLAWVFNENYNNPMYYDGEENPYAKNAKTILAIIRKLFDIYPDLDLTKRTSFEGNFLHYVIKYKLGPLGFLLSEYPSVIKNNKNFLQSCTTDSNLIQAIISEIDSAVKELKRYIFRKFKFLRLDLDNLTREVINHYTPHQKHRKLSNGDKLMWLQFPAPCASLPSGEVFNLNIENLKNDLLFNLNQEPLKISGNKLCIGGLCVPVFSNQITPLMHLNLEQLKNLQIYLKKIRNLIYYLKFLLFIQGQQLPQVIQSNQEFMNLYQDFMILLRHPEFDELIEINLKEIISLIVIKNQ